MVDAGSVESRLDDLRQFAATAEEMLAADDPGEPDSPTTLKASPRVGGLRLVGPGSGAELEYL